MDKLSKAFQLFDEYNRRDPVTFVWKGQAWPQEYFLALRLYDWVLKLDPSASEELVLASRSQHIGRWEIPRKSYPDGREGYLKWRKDLSVFHAQTSAGLMEKAGYDEATIARVKQIILKQRIKTDKDVQTMENALCLVFLEFQYEAFHPAYPPEKVVNILKRSLLKMDSEGHRFALGLNYSDEGLKHIQAALSLITKE